MKLIDKVIEISKHKNGWKNLPDKHREPNIVSFSCPGNWIENENKIDEYGNCKYECNCEECWNREI